MLLLLLLLNKVLLGLEGHQRLLVTGSHHAVRRPLVWPHRCIGITHEDLVEEEDTVGIELEGVLHEEVICERGCRIAIDRY